MILASQQTVNEKPVKIIGFIPARAESTRFPGKPLADICGRPMIMRVFERTLRCPLLTEVYVATDSEEILETVQQHGGRALLTSRNHACGTDRIAEGARLIQLQASDIAVNVQGDQPLFDPVMVEEVVAPLLRDETVPMSTLIYRIVREEEVTHPNAVKTAVDVDGFAVYFSRATIPYFGNPEIDPVYYKHHGIYAYRNDFLQRFAKLPQGILEKAERLEQLRALEHGYRIKVVITDKDSVEVDTPADLERVRETYAKMI
jgi:3-deoxy-manno-octulosonate cytidylyltransferase (CMP-KDO synthetase)